MFGFKFYPNSANIYTIQDGVDGDIFQVYPSSFFINSFSYHILTLASSGSMLSVVTEFGAASFSPDIGC